MEVLGTCLGFCDYSTLLAARLSSSSLKRGTAYAVQALLRLEIDSAGKWAPRLSRYFYLTCVHFSDLSQRLVDGLVEYHYPTSPMINIKSARIDRSIELTFRKLLGNLKVLSLNETTATDKVLQTVFPAAPKLQRVELRRTKVADAAIISLAQSCLDLSSIEISETSVTDAAIAALAKHCPNLEVLIALNTKLTDESLRCLAHCEPMNLIVLQLGRNVTDEGLKALAQKSGLMLKDFLVASPKVTSSGIEALAASTPQLECLSISGTQVNDQGICAVASVCRKLKKLDFSWTNTGDTALEGLGLNSSTLEDLRCPRQITDKGLLAITQSFPNLRHISVGGSKVTDASLEPLLRRSIRQLETLAIGGTQITDGLFRRLFGAPSVQQERLAAPVLRFLDLSWTAVGDEAIMCIVSASPAVEHLDLWGTQLTDAGLEAIAPLVSNLQNIALANTKVTDDGILALSKHTPNLTTLNANFTKVTPAGLSCVMQSLNKVVPVRSLPFGF